MVALRAQNGGAGKVGERVGEQEVEETGISTGEVGSRAAANRQAWWKEKESANERSADVIRPLEAA